MFEAQRTYTLTMFKGTKYRTYTGLSYMLLTDFAKARKARGWITVSIKEEV